MLWVCYMTLTYTEAGFFACEHDPVSQDEPNPVWVRPSDCDTAFSFWLGAEADHD